MAWVRAGWKGPPKGECLRRWQGRTWPWVKKVEKILGRGLVGEGFGQGEGAVTCSQSRCRLRRGSSGGWRGQRRILGGGCPRLRGRRVCIRGTR